MDKKNLQHDEEILKQQKISNDTKAAEKSAEADIEKDLILLHQKIPEMI